MRQVADQGRNPTRASLWPIKSAKRRRILNPIESNFEFIEGSTGQLEAKSGRFDGNVRVGLIDQRPVFTVRRRHSDSRLLPIDRQISAQLDNAGF
jgi:hypothetical protein